MKEIRFFLFKVSLLTVTAYTVTAGLGLSFLSTHEAFAQTLAKEKIGQELYVQVQAAKIRNAPRQWASGLSDVKFGDKLHEISKENSWMLVKNDSSIEGYLHASAVTSKKIVLSASTETLLKSSVDEPDVYLAGKGFNEALIKAYATNEASLDFEAVNLMQKQSHIDESMLHSFIESGHLKEGLN